MSRLWDHSVNPDFNQSVHSALEGPKKSFSGILAAPGNIRSGDRFSRYPSCSPVARLLLVSPPDLTLSRCAITRSAYRGYDVYCVPNVARNFNPGRVWAHPWLFYGSLISMWWHLGSVACVEELD